MDAAIWLGCVSYFWILLIFGAAELGTAPRVVGSWFAVFGFRERRWRVRAPFGMKGGELGAVGSEGCFMLAGAAFEQALATGLHALGFGLGQELGVNLGPFLCPTVITDEVAQGQHGVDMRAQPVHAGALEPRFDDRLVGAFDHAAADGPALLDERRVLELRLPFGQIGVVVAQRLALWILGLELTQFSQQ